MQRWFYRGRRQQRALPLSRYPVTAGLVGVALIAVLVVLAIVVRPAGRSEVLRPDRRTSAAGTAPAAAGTASPSPSDGNTGTSVPSQPPLPSEAPSTSPSPAKPTRKPPVDPPHDIRAFTVEAESATSTLIGRARIRTDSGASGRHTIGFVGTDPENRSSSGALVVNGLDVPARGTYTLTVFYAAGDGDRRARIRVDGAVLGTVTFPSTGDWNAIGSLTLRVGLAGGRNAVEFDNPDDFAPDFDRVALSN